MAAAGGAAPSRTPRPLVGGLRCLPAEVAAHRTPPLAWGLLWPAEAFSRGCSGHGHFGCGRPGRGCWKTEAHPWLQASVLTSPKPTWGQVGQAPAEGAMRPERGGCRVNQQRVASVRKGSLSARGWKGPPSSKCPPVCGGPVVLGWEEGAGTGALPGRRGFVEDHAA